MVISHVTHYCLFALSQAVEEDGSDPNELEVSVVDIASPKATGRRSVGRAKKSMGSESEEAKVMLLLKFVVQAEDQ